MQQPPPDLDVEDLVTALQESWAIEVEEIAYLPLGAGSHHWRVSGRGNCFVTVDDLAAKLGPDVDDLNRAAAALHGALETAAVLQAGGLRFVAAPLRSREHHVMHVVENRFAVSVFSWIDGEHHEWGQALGADWVADVVEVLAVLHGTPLAESSSLAVEDFRLPDSDLIAPTSVGDWPNEGPLARSAAGLFFDHREATASKIAAFDRLGASIRRDRMVITHGEPHPGNTISTADGLVLIDWDTAKVAPPERDLWSIVDRDPSAASAYALAGGCELDSLALDFYRLRWDLDDMCAYARELAQPHTVTLDTEFAVAEIERYVTDS